MAEWELQYEETNPLNLNHAPTMVLVDGYVYVLLLAWIFTRLQEIHLLALRASKLSSFKQCFALDLHRETATYLVGRVNRASVTAAVKHD